MTKRLLLVVLLGCLLSGLFLTSCGDDYLEDPPDGDDNPDGDDPDGDDPDGDDPDGDEPDGDDPDGDEPDGDDPDGDDPDGDDPDGDDPDGDDPEPLDILGDYLDGWEGFHRITADSWQQGVGPDASFFNITQYDNDTMMLIAQNDSDNTWNPDLWSRFDWTWTSAGTRTQTLYYCQTVYDAASEQAALDTTAADATDLTTGCGGFAWSMLTPGDEPLAIIGNYDDSWSMHHDITQTSWVQSGYGTPSVFHISQFNNTNQVLITQNDHQNTYNPGLWSRFDWTWADSGTRTQTSYYCQTAYDAASEQAALDTARADDSDLATGCGGNAWSSLTPGDAFPMIMGDFTDDYSMAHAISETSWTQSGFGDPSIFTFTQIDNQIQTLIAQNDSANPYNPDLWSRFDWTWNLDATNGWELYICQTTYDAASEQAALDTARADDSNLATGCGGFGWSKLTRATSSR